MASLFVPLSCLLLANDRSLLGGRFGDMTKLGCYALQNNYLLFSSCWVLFFKTHYLTWADKLFLPNWLVGIYLIISGFIIWSLVILKLFSNELENFVHASSKFVAQLKFHPLIMIVIFKGQRIDKKLSYVPSESWSKVWIQFVANHFANPSLICFAALKQKG